jgi:pilus assembly protein CpaB
MSSALRLSIILVLLLATTALGLTAYNMNLPKQVPVAVMEQGPAPPSTVGYFVAARPLSKGTLAREEDFAVRSVPPERLPAGAILETPDSKVGLPGSLVRKFVDVGSPITLQDVLRPRDRGFLASVLAPDSRAISIKVDEESGVSGLIRPGDHVDVLLTQVFLTQVFEKAAPAVFEKAAPARRALSETVLSNVRVIAIDQELVQGERTVSSVAGKQAQTVSLELAPDQVEKITVAKQLGTLSLAVRAAVEQWDTADTGAMSSCDVSPEIARQKAIAGRTATVAIISGGQTKQYSVRKQDSDDRDTMVNCDGLEASRRGATVVAGKLLEKR